MLVLDGVQRYPLSSMFPMVSVKAVFCLHYFLTCTWMFVVNNVMSFNEVWRKSLYNFKQRVTKSNNVIVNHV